jgi:hypothetical protein
LDVNLGRGIKFILKMNRLFMMEWDRSFLKVKILTSIAPWQKVFRRKNFSVSN